MSLECVGIGQAAIERMGYSLLPNPRGLLSVLGFNLRRGVLKHTEEIDPAFTVERQDFIEVGDVELPPFFADDKRTKRAVHIGKAFDDCRRDCADKSAAGFAARRAENE